MALSGGNPLVGLVTNVKVSFSEFECLSAVVVRVCLSLMWRLVGQFQPGASQ